MTSSGYHINIGNATDVGKLRSQNEDYLAHFDSPAGYCVIVCDGMGGHAAGAVASQNATMAIKQYLQDKGNLHADVPVMMKNAIEFANFQLREMVTRDPGLKGMGTTCVMVLIKDGQMYTAHAGDSRIYMMRKDVIKQVTKDHSSVQKLIDMGALTEAEAELSDKKHQISKAIGIFEQVEPTVSATARALHKDDKILLCSDGLTGHVKKEKIFEIIAAAADTQEAAVKLVKQANDGGGTDNITVQLIHYTGKTVYGKRKLSVRKIAAALSVLAIACILSLWLYKNYSVKTENIKESKTEQVKTISKDTIPSGSKKSNPKNR